MAVDWSDPCARFAALRDTYFQVVKGGQEVEIETRTLDAQERVRFSPASLETLRNEMRAAEAECKASTGADNPNRRFAIGLSYRR